jgi:hypothetical protein
MRPLLNGGTLGGLGTEATLDIDTEVKNLAELCLKLIDRDGIDSMRPLTCVPSTKQLSFMMDRRGVVDPDVVRTWGLAVASPAADFLVAYQSDTDKFTIDAVVAGAVTSATFEAPDAYI